MVATAMIVSAGWILAAISADTTASVEPVWRYTTEGWTELSELTPPSSSKTPGILDNVSPLVWGALQALTALAILISFSEGSQQPKVDERGFGLQTDPSHESIHTPRAP